MRNPAIEEVEIIRVGGSAENTVLNETDNALRTLDTLSMEEPLEIKLIHGKEGHRNLKSISITMRTPGNDAELATGFLFTEGIIKRLEDIIEINRGNAFINPENNIVVNLGEQVQTDLLKLERNFYTTSSCGVCGKASIDAVRTTSEDHKQELGDHLRIEKEILFGLPNSLREKQAVFQSTGGLHASALFDLDGNLVQAMEDVGRHNALDKLIGLCLAKGLLPLNKYILLLSGRASFELIQKAAMAHIKMVAAIGAPSSLAVQMAKEFDITLVGFLRNNTFNIYSKEDRIKL